MREALLKLKEQAEAEKAEHMRRLDEAEKTIAQTGQLRAELIGRANQAVGALAVIEKLLAEPEGEAAGDDEVASPPELVKLRR